MKFGRKTRAAFVGIACWGILAQQTPSFAGPPALPASATNTSDTKAKVKVTDAKSNVAESKVAPTAAKKPVQPAAIDVALADEGTVTGRVIDERQNGVPDAQEGGSLG